MVNFTWLKTKLKEYSILLASDIPEKMIEDTEDDIHSFIAKTWFQMKDFVSKGESTKRSLQSDYILATHNSNEPVNFELLAETHEIVQQVMGNDDCYTLPRMITEMNELYNTVVSNITKKLVQCETELRNAYLIIEDISVLDQQVKRKFREYHRQQQLQKKN